MGAQSLLHLAHALSPPNLRRQKREGNRVSTPQGNTRKLDRKGEGNSGGGQTLSD